MKQQKNATGQCRGIKVIITNINLDRALSKMNKFQIICQSRTQVIAQKHKNCFVKSRGITPEREKWSDAGRTDEHE